MFRRNATIALLVVLPLAAFVLGVVSLLNLRMEAGDIYPAYSSLRTDPLGTKMLYEGLDGVEGISVARNYKPLSSHVIREDATLVLAGARTVHLKWAASALFENLETFVAQGGRLVIAFAPTTGIERRRGERDRDDDEEEEPGKSAEETEPESSEPGEEAAGDTIPGTSPPRSIEETWGVRLAYERLSPMDEESETADAITWNSTLYFEPMNEAWRTLCLRGELPVVIERSLGRGRIVLASDSYFLSNEAMVRERRPDVLHVVLGDKPRIYFDESHLGISRRPGLMMLAYKYRLKGLIVSLAILAVLFIWKSASSLLPPRGAGREAVGDAVGGKDAAEGFLNLLRRNVPPSALIDICLDEWERACLQQDEKLFPARDRMRAAAHAKDDNGKTRDPVSVYRDLRSILKERE